MATVDKAFIDQRIDHYINSMAMSAIKYGQNLMKKKRLKILNEWFEGVEPSLSNYYARNTMWRATVFKIPIIEKNSKYILVKFISYIDIDLYEPDTRSAERWVKKHDQEEPPKEWILNQQLVEGIVGLPEYALTYFTEHSKEYNRGGWENGKNLHYHAAAEGLEEFMDNHSLWDDFGSELRSLMKK